MYLFAYSHNQLCGCFECFHAHGCPTPGASRKGGCLGILGLTEVDHHNFGISGSIINSHYLLS